MKKYAIWLNAIPVFAICYAVGYLKAWGIAGYIIAISYFLGTLYGVWGLVKMATYSKFPNKDKKEHIKLLKDAIFLLLCWAILSLVPILAPSD